MCIVCFSVNTCAQNTIIFHEKTHFDTKKVYQKIAPPLLEQVCTLLHRNITFGTIICIKTKQEEIWLK